MTDPLVPATGDVYVLGEDDYRFGLGALRVRVDHVVAPINFGESGRVQRWWQVRAHCKPSADTHDWDGLPRELYLRASALRSALRSS